MSAGNVDPLFSTRRVLRAVTVAAALAVLAPAWLRWLALDGLTPWARRYVLAVALLWPPVVALLTVPLASLLARVLRPRLAGWVQLALLALVSAWFAADAFSLRTWTVHVGPALVASAGRRNLALAFVGGAWALAGLGLAFAASRLVRAGARWVGPVASVLSLALAVALVVPYPYFRRTELEPPADPAVALAGFPAITADKLLAEKGVAQRPRRYEPPPALGVPLPAGWKRPSPPRASPPPNGTAKSFDARAWPAPARRMNVLILGADSLRPDVLNARVMPRLFALTQRALTSARHVSNSNCTYQGLFSLLYGQTPFSWEAARQSGTEPTLFALLRAAGYRVRHGSSIPLADLEVPKFMLRPEESLRDYRPWNTWEADARLADDVAAFVRSPGDPWVAFAFFNSTHHNYPYPPEAEVFTPAASEQFDIHDRSLAPQRDELFRRYENAAHYVDGLAAKVLRAVDESGQADRTVVVFTGDHGEAFFENGRMAHAFTFSRYETDVPLVIAIPGAPRRRIPRTTEHVDVVPTVLAALGVPLAGLPLDGVPLQASEGRGYALVAHCGLSMPREFAISNDFGYQPFKIGTRRLELLPPLKHVGYDAPLEDAVAVQTLRRIVPPALERLAR